VNKDVCVRGQQAPLHLALPLSYAHISTSSAEMLAAHCEGGQV